MKEISFIIPSRNNLKYLKWAVASIRKNQAIQHEICVADDFSNDGTWDWCIKQMKLDKNFKAIRNNGPERMGLTLLYDILINTVATKDYCMIYHADMYFCPELDVAIDKHLKPGVIVSATRIEPPLHPAGPEKILFDCGIEPENFDEEKLLVFLESSVKNSTPTNGIFAPWAFYKKDFQDINGHDPLYRPQTKEDSDIFNRFKLNGIEFVQTWEGLVYHLTCRGSRFNPTITTVGTASSEWLAQNERSSRNFIRKWGHFVRHDNFLNPIIPHKYNIGLVIQNCDIKFLKAFEPWCSNIFVDMNWNEVTHYINEEQKNTDFNLNERVKHIKSVDETNNDIIVTFNAADFKYEHQQNFIQILSDVLTDSGKVGKLHYDIFIIDIRNMNTYEKNLIVREVNPNVKISNEIIIYEHNS